jgi:hypothetical protein
VAEREWKPGDVAVRTNVHDRSRGRSLVVSGEDCPNRQADTHPKRPHWHHQGGGWDYLPGEDAADYEESTYWPLVVIDPEDTEQIERLDAIYQRVLDTSPRFHGLAQVMATALREFANPTTPRPDEPTGKFAEVQNAEGMVYYRSPAGTWLRQSDNLERPWDHIDAVKVLSEGIR